MSALSLTNLYVMDLAKDLEGHFSGGDFFGDKLCTYYSNNPYLQAGLLRYHFTSGGRKQGNADGLSLRCMSREGKLNNEIWMNNCFVCSPEETDYQTFLINSFSLHLLFFSEESVPLY